jgi:cell division protein FtsB
VETPREPSPTPSPDHELIASLRREIVELKARITDLSNRNAELTQQINNERYERPPHY